MTNHPALKRATSVIMAIVLILSSFIAVSAIAIISAGIPIATAVDGAAFIGETPYDTLADAVTAANAATEDTTITLGTNVSETIVVNNDAGKKVTLDLNGFVLTGIKSNNVNVLTPFVLTDSKIDEGTGKYTSAYENTFFNYYATAVCADITIENAVVENTCTSVTTCRVSYWTLNNAKIIITGDKTKILYDSEYCALSSSSYGIVITGGNFYQDPSALLTNPEYMSEKYTADDGVTMYRVVVRPPVYNWIDERDEAGVTVDETGNIYTVTSPEGLAQIAYLVNNGNNFKYKTVVLGADIDLGKEFTYWTPIGTTAKPFKGIFDGAGYTVSNLNILGGFAYTGLFGYVRGEGETNYTPTLKNLVIDNATVNGTAHTAVLTGGLHIGKAENITVQGDVIVTGKQYTAIIVGQGYCSMISCNVNVNEGSIVDTGSGRNGYFVGGIIGHWGHGTMTNCHVTGLTIYADWGVGGLAGYAASDGLTRTVVSFSSCEDVEFTSTKAYGDVYFGGAVGSCESIDIKKTYVKDIILPDTSKEIGYIAGETDNKCTAEDVCYINVQTNNPNIGLASAYIEGQSEAQARASTIVTEDNPYGVGYYMGSASGSEEDENLPFDQTVLAAEEGEEIIISGHVEEFILEPVTIGKRISINFGMCYNPSFTYVVPAAGYEVNVNTDEAGNTILEVEEEDYTATFVDREGNVVGTDTFNISDMTVTEPAVPAYGGFLASWEDYELTYADITIHPYYNPDIFLVTSNTTNCTFTGAATANRGVAYTASLAPASADYRLPFNVSVKVGGAALSNGSYIYNAGTGALTISADAVTGYIEVSAVSTVASSSFVTWTAYPGQGGYSLSDAGIIEEEITMEYATGTNISFTVVLSAYCNMSAYTVYNNGVALAPNSDGSFTISNVDGQNVITMSGIKENPSPQVVEIIEDISFVEKVLMLIINFFNTIKKLFGIS